jgi:hypothetical protein
MSEIQFKVILSLVLESQWPRDESLTNILLFICPPFYKLSIYQSCRPSIGTTLSQQYPNFLMPNAAVNHIKLFDALTFTVFN